ncbi:MAG: hypothetical protein SF029_06850 [bacterium]|nr:hypothetical protein [bacterium]
MILFTVFVFGAVILGAGAMLSPAWPTAQPRIGLAATFALALIVGGAVFLTALFGWQTLLVDYLLFALVVGIFLGGTLSVGQQRAEKRGETLSDADQGWPSARDLAFFAGVGLAFLLLALFMPARASDASLTLQAGDTLDQLTQASIIQPPAFTTLSTYLSTQLGQSLESVQRSIGAVLGLLNVWLLSDFVTELRGARPLKKNTLRLRLIVFMLPLIVLFWVGAYPSMLGLAFAQAAAIFGLRYLRAQYLIDAIAAGLMLGAVAISSFPVLLLVVILAVVALGVGLLRGQQGGRRTWAVLMAGVPVVALLAISPWLLDLLL